MAPRRTSGFIGLMPRPKSVAHAPRPRCLLIQMRHPGGVDAQEQWALLGVIDGLGHGPHAAAAADRASALLQSVPMGNGSTQVLRDLHQALRGTRGAAATVCILRQGTLSVCGVGNVAIRSRGTSVPFILSPGVLGSRVQNFRTAEVALSAGDRLVVYTDGVSSRFSLDLLRQLDAEAACDAIFNDFAKLTDDATIAILDVC